MPLIYSNNNDSSGNLDDFADNVIQFRSGTSGKDWFARHKDQESTPFENLIEALAPQVYQYCQPYERTTFIAYLETGIFCLIVTFLLLGLLKYCHYQFSKTASINKLTLRPLLVALFSLIIAGARQIFLVFGVDEGTERYFEAIERLTKLSVLMVGISQNFNKEMLNLFMIF